MKTYVIDLFCGAGGTSTAIFESKTNIEVVACINHDKNAILSHAQNYPDCLHLTEDIRTAALESISELVNNLRKKETQCKIAIWASLECTNYSKAKGGLPKDADSRTLAEHLFRYFDVFNPDFIWIENVREFMSWGPLDKNGKPISRYKGIYYLSWVQRIEKLGYYYEYRLLNSADYGGFTTRTRYFGQFSKNQKAISFPATTHEKRRKTGGGLFQDYKKPWKAVKSVLDLEDEGNSIFTRKKALVDSTLERIYAGLLKFIPNGDDQFIKKYYSGDPNSKVISMDQPAGSITTIDGHAKVKAVFLNTYYGNGGTSSVNHPAPTVTTKDRISKATCVFMTNYYSGGGQITDIEGPSGTITTVPKSRVTTVNFIDNQYGNSKPQSVNKPSGTITVNPKQSFVSVNSWIMNTNFNNVGSTLDKPSPTILASRKHFYLMNPQYNSKGRSVENPCFTLIARMDKAPPYLVNTDLSENFLLNVSNFLKEHDLLYIFDECNNVFGPRIKKSIRIKIIEFMVHHGIVDIKMRMLKIPELLQIQGFPKNYKLVGTQTEQKKYIGNSVEVNVGVALFRSIDSSIQQLKNAS